MVREGKKLDSLINSFKLNRSRAEKCRGLVSPFDEDLYYHLCMKDCFVDDVAIDYELYVVMREVWNYEV